MKKLLVLIFCLFNVSVYSQFEVLKSSAEEGFVNNDGVKIHYLEWGEGPLVIMLHGFPDFWYSWRHLIPELAISHKVVAVDLRGYNLSDHPHGVENYTMRILMTDLVAVINHYQAKDVTLIANDWGGAIAWNVALYYPNKVNRLIACNIPYPNNISKYISKHPETAQYARNYQENSSEGVTAELLASYIPDSKAHKYYLKAFQRSSIEAMLNYYKASYPSGNQKTTSQKSPPPPANPRKIKCPVLMVYGLKDQALPPGMMNDTWDYIDNQLTIHTIPDGGHFIQQEKPEIVNRVIKVWLNMYKE